MGAMHVLYDTDLDAEEIATQAIEAAAKFDDGSGLPVELVKIAEKRTKTKSGQSQ